MIPIFSSLYAALLQFAVGSLFAALISETGGKVTPGFLRQAAVAALLGALLAWLMTGRGAVGEAESALSLLLLLAVYTILQFTSRRTARLRLGWLGLVVGVIAMVLAAMARPSPSLGPLWTGLSAAASAVALGTSMMALILGHWYLVTPRLSATPLRVLCDLTILSLVALTGIALWYVLERPAATAFGPDVPIFRWAGFVAVTLFPIGITIAARICCQEWPRGRAIQAATGLLYITAALVLTGALAGNMVLLTG
jgi:hypothetical protein